MPARNLAFASLPPHDGVVLWIVAITSQPPTNEDWASYLEALEKRLNGGRIKTLVYTDGGGPNAAQRKSMIDMFYSKGIKSVPTCMVSSSALVRGLTTALSWFNPDIKAVNPDQLHEALRYLNISPSQFELVTAELKKLRAELAGEPQARVATRP